MENSKDDLISYEKYGILTNKMKENKYFKKKCSGIKEKNSKNDSHKRLDILNSLDTIEMFSRPSKDIGRLKLDINTLVSQNPEGLILDEFCDVFSRHFKYELNVSDYDCNSISNLILTYCTNACLKPDGNIIKIYPVVTEAHSGCKLYSEVTLDKGKVAKQNMRRKKNVDQKPNDSGKEASTVNIDTMEKSKVSRSKNTPQIDTEKLSNSGLKSSSHKKRKKNKKKSAYDDSLLKIIVENDPQRNQEVLPARVEIPEEITETFRRILKSFGGAIDIDEIVPKYEYLSGKKLNIADLGFHSILDLLTQMHNEFGIHQMSNSQYILYEKKEHPGWSNSANFVWENREKSSSDAPLVPSCLSRQTCKNLRFILEHEFPFGLTLPELVGAYKGFYGENDDLNPAKYGLDCLEPVLARETHVLSLVREFGHLIALPLDTSLINLEGRKDGNYFSDIANHVPYNIVGPKEMFTMLDISSLFPQQSCVEAVVGEVMTPTKFYIIRRSVHNSEVLDEMMDRLFEFYSSPLGDRYKVPAQEIALDMPVAALYKADQNYYRAIITSREDLSTLKLFYVDYGTYCRATAASLRYLHRHFFKLPAQAVKAGLYGIEPSGKQGEKVPWPRSSSSHFLSLVQDKYFTTYVNEYIDDQLLVTMIDEETNQSISDLLIASSKAKLKNGAILPEGGNQTTPSDKSSKRGRKHKSGRSKQSAAAFSPAMTQSSCRAASQIDPILSSKFVDPVAVSCDKNSGPDQRPKDCIEVETTLPLPSLEVLDTQELCKKIDSQLTGKQRTPEVCRKRSSNCRDTQSPSLNTDVVEGWTTPPLERSGLEVFYSDEDDYYDEKLNVQQGENLDATLENRQDSPRDEESIIHPQQDVLYSENRAYPLYFPPDKVFHVVVVKDKSYLPFPEFKHVVGQYVSLKTLSKHFIGTKYEITYLEIEPESHLDVFLLLSRFGVSYLYPKENCFIKKLQLLLIESILKVIPIISHNIDEDFTEKLMELLSSCVEKDGKEPNKVSDCEKVTSETGVAFADVEEMISDLNLASNLASDSRAGVECLSPHPVCGSVSLESLPNNPTNMGSSSESSLINRTDAVTPFEKGDVSSSLGSRNSPQRTLIRKDDTFRSPSSATNRLLSENWTLLKKVHDSLKAIKVKTRDLECSKGEPSETEEYESDSSDVTDDSSDDSDTTEEVDKESVDEFEMLPTEASTEDDVSKPLDMGQNGSKNTDTELTASVSHTKSTPEGAAMSEATLESVVVSKDPLRTEGTVVSKNSLVTTSSAVIPTKTTPSSGAAVSQNCFQTRTTPSNFQFRSPSCSSFRNSHTPARQGALVRTNPPQMHYYSGMQFPNQYYSPTMNNSPYPYNNYGANTYYNPNSTSFRCPSVNTPPGFSANDRNPLYYSEINPYCQQEFVNPDGQHYYYGGWYQGFN